MAIQVRAGHIIGRDHMARQANTQDSFAVAEFNGSVVGVVCDGCSEGAHSEVGAKLAAQHIVSQTLEMLRCGIPIEKIPDMLYPRIIGFLDYLVLGMNPPNRVEFIRHHLLFTIVGVIASDEGAVTFTAGDGLVVIGDDITEIDQNNRPAYIAYHLLNKEMLNGFDMPDRFDMQTVSDWERLAVASDGFEPELLPDVWGQKHPRALQRKMNVWSNMERRFRDDATIITLERASDDDC